MSPDSGGRSGLRGDMWASSAFEMAFSAVGLDETTQGRGS